MLLPAFQDKELLAPGGLFVGMELSDFAGGENGVDVNLDGIFDATGIAAGDVVTTGMWRLRASSNTFLSGAASPSIVSDSPPNWSSW